MTYAVETRHLSKTIDGSPILNDITMSVKQGEIYGFLGANGAGKTSLMKTLYHSFNSFRLPSYGLFNDFHRQKRCVFSHCLSIPPSLCATVSAQYLSCGLLHFWNAQLISSTSRYFPKAETKPFRKLPSVPIFSSAASNSLIRAAAFAARYSVLLISPSAKDSYPACGAPAQALSAGYTAVPVCNSCRFAPPRSPWSVSPRPRRPRPPALPPGG